MENKKIKLFTHNDLDGVGCSILMYNYASTNHTHYLNYNEVNYEITSFINSGKVDEYDEIFITDISVNEEVAELINEKYAEKFILIDHHKTALWLNKYDWAFVKKEEAANIKACGTSLLFWYIKLRGYQFINKKLVKEFVELVRKYDTWEWKTNNEILPFELNILFKSMPIFEFSKNINKKIVKNKPIFGEADYKAISIYKDMVNRYIDERMYYQYITKNYHYYVTFAEDHVSAIGDQFLEKNPEVDFIAIVNMNSYSISFRTKKKDIDVSEIAKLFYGGGHPQASGGFIRNQVFDFNNNILEILN